MPRLGSAPKTASAVLTSTSDVGRKPAPVPSFPLNDSTVTITEAPPAGFQFDNSVPSAFDTSMFPPCLRPLVNYQLTETECVPSVSEITPFSPHQVHFIFTELIENDLYSNVMTNDWVKLTSKLNTVYSTQFNFRDVRHYALRVVLQSVIQWIKNENTQIRNPGYTIGLIIFYYHGVLLHSMIKEGAFDVLGTSLLCFPDPVYELYMDSGFIPPTRRTVHGATGHVVIHNPTQLSKVFEPSLHADNPHWAQTNHPSLHEKYPDHPNHTAIPFHPTVHQFITVGSNSNTTNPPVNFNVTSLPQQHIVIQNTTSNPTSGITAWGPVAPEIFVTAGTLLSDKQTTINTIETDLHAIGDFYSANDPKDHFHDPYAYLSGSDARITTQTISIQQVTKAIPANRSTYLRRTISDNIAHLTKSMDNILVNPIKQSPAQQVIRNNFIIKNTFTPLWIKTHRDRYGDFANYALPLIEQFQYYMLRAYPTYKSNPLDSVYSLTTPDTKSTAFWNKKVNEEIFKEPTKQNILALRPFNEYYFSDDWTNGIDTIPDCQSQRLFSAYRRADQVRVTPTQSMANVIGTLSQSIVGGQMRTNNPIESPLFHPLTTARSNLELVSNPGAVPLSSMNRMPDYSTMQPTAIIKSMATCKPDLNIGVWGYYDDGWYSNTGFPHLISPPIPPKALFPTQTDSLEPKALPSALLLHPEESRFYFILQQKFALYITRRGLRRSYLDHFFKPVHESSISSQGQVGGIIGYLIKNTNSLLALQGAINPRREARYLMLTKTYADPRIPPFYTDFLLKITHMADCHNALGMNLTVLSRFNHSHFIRTVISTLQNHIIQLNLGSTQNPTGSRALIDALARSGVNNVAVPWVPFACDAFLNKGLSAPQNNFVVADSLGQGQNADHQRPLSSSIRLDSRIESQAYGSLHRFLLNLSALTQGRSDNWTSMELFHTAFANYLLGTTSRAQYPHESPYSHGSFGQPAVLAQNQGMVMQYDRHDDSDDSDDDSDNADEGSRSENCSIM